MALTRVVVYYPNFVYGVYTVYYLILFTAFTRSHILVLTVPVNVYYPNFFHGVNTGYCPNFVHGVYTSLHFIDTNIDRTQC